MNDTYTSPNLPPNIVGLGEYSDKDLLAELVSRGVIDLNGGRVDNMVSHEQIREIFGV